MRKCVGKDAKEGLSLLLVTQPRQGTLVNKLGTILLTVVVIFTIHGVLNILLQHLTHHTGIAHGTAITIQKIGEIKMCLELTYVAIEFVHTTFIRCRDATLITACPLAEHTCMIASRLHNLRQDRHSRVVGFLPHYGIIHILTVLHASAPIFLVATHMGVTRVLTSHKTGTRWSGNRTAGIGRRHTHTLRSQAINMGRTEMLLTVARKITIPHIITHYIYNVGASSLGLRQGGRSQNGEE